MGKNHHKIQSPEVVEEGKRLQLEIKKKFKNYETASQAFNIEEIGFSVSKATIAQYCGGSIRIPDKKLFYIANKLNISISKIRKDANFCYANYGKRISSMLLELLNRLKISPNSIYKISSIQPYDIKRIFEGDFNIRKHDLEKILTSINVDEDKFLEPIKDIFNFDNLDYYTEKTIETISSMDSNSKDSFRKSISKQKIQSCNNIHLDHIVPAQEICNKENNEMTIDDNIIDKNHREYFDTSKSNISYFSSFIKNYLHQKSEKTEIQEPEQLENEILSFFNYFLDLCSECYDDKLPERLKMEMIRRITLK